MFLFRPPYDSAPRCAIERNHTMKLILMMGMKKENESQSRGIMTWPQEDIQAHILFVIGFNKQLKAAGELVSAARARLAGSSQAGSGR
jgi:hypothetical protein